MEDKKRDKVERQVEIWELYARILPPVFLLISILLVSFQIIDFDTAFYVGLGLFSCTAVVWWFWTIFTIRQLVRTLGRATKNLNSVRSEFRDINAIIQNELEKEIKRNDS
jgi:hypothetical protein